MVEFSYKRDSQHSKRYCGAKPFRHRKPINYAKLVCYAVRNLDQAKVVVQDWDY